MIKRDLFRSRTDRKIGLRCAIWYHFYNLKNVKNTDREVLLSVKLQALACIITKSNTPPLYKNCTNGTKSRNTPQLEVSALTRTKSCLNTSVKTVTKHNLMKLFEEFKLM